MDNQKPDADLLNLWHKPVQPAPRLAVLLGRSKLNLACRTSWSGQVEFQYTPVPAYAGHAALPVPRLRWQMQCVPAIYCPPLHCCKCRASTARALQSRACSTAHQLAQKPGHTTAPFVPAVASKPTWRTPRAARHAGVLQATATLVAPRAASLPMVCNIGSSGWLRAKTRRTQCATAALGHGTACFFTALACRSALSKWLLSQQTSANPDSRPLARWATRTTWCTAWQIRPTSSCG